jgi:DMSO/TMAO reductase YedYZ heme-binding membrane subunit
MLDTKQDVATGNRSLRVLDEVFVFSTALKGKIQRQDSSNKNKYSYKKQVDIYVYIYIYIHTYIYNVWQRKLDAY